MIILSLLNENTFNQYINVFKIQAFDDRPTLTSILVQLAILGLAESNWGQAVALLLEAQVSKHCLEQITS